MKEYIKVFMESIEEFNENNKVKYVRHIDTFKEDLNYNETAHFNSIICTLNTEQINKLEVFLTSMFNAGGIEYCLENMFQLFNNSRKKISEDFEFIYTNSDLIDRKKSIEKFINDRCAYAHLIAHREAIDKIVEIFYESRLYDNILELKLKADHDSE